MSGRQITDIYPLTSMQEGMLFHTLYAPDSGVYCQQIGFLLSGRLDPAALRQAWQIIVARHGALRTGFVWENRDKPLQAVFDQVDLPWQEVDLRPLPAAAQHERLDRLMTEDRARPYDVKQPPLMRLLLVRLGEERYQLLWSMHHLIIDGWSVSIILGELRDLYLASLSAATSEATSSRPPATQFREHVAWLARQDVSLAEGFWRDKLAGFSVPTPILGDRSRVESHSELTRYAWEEVQLDDDTTQQLRDLAQHHKLTLNTILQGAWALLLSRQSGEQDVLFGVVSSGRSQTVPGIESIVGLCVNTLPARVHVDPLAAAATWLTSLQEEQIDTRQYEYCPLTDIQSWTTIPAGTPMFDSILGTENFPLDLGQLAELGDLELDINVLDTKTSSPLSVIIIPGRQLTVRALYDADRWEASVIRRCLQHYRALLRAFIADPEAPLGSFCVLTPQERQQILVDWNRTAVDLPHETLVHQLVEGQARRTPDAVAVATGDRAVSYSALNAHADRLAVRLGAAGVGRGDLVGVCLERSPEMLVSALATWKVGAAYLPLDPSYPNERLAFMLADARPAVIVTLPLLRGRLPAGGCPIVDLQLQDGLPPDDDRPGSPVGGAMDDPAYVIYTSGSTGQPNGVPTTHRSLVNLIQWHQRSFEVTAHDRATLIASPGFDASMWEAWPYLTAGSSLHIPSADTRLSISELIRWLTEQQITLTFLPTPLAERALGEPWPAQCRLRFLLTGGDRLRTRPPAGLPFRVVNNYGPTENTVVTTSAVIDAAPDGGSPPSIGRPIDNTRVYVLDAGGQPVPVDVLGELHLAGVGLSSGYLGRPDATRARFVTNPFEPGEVMYRTGDLVRYRPDGNLEFFGRNDEQVKIHGYRIELGEIEATLARHPGVRQAAVTTGESRDGSPRLLAYVVPEPSDGAEAGAGADHMDAWLALYDETYRQPAPVADTSLNTVGWQSSYTGEQIPAAVLLEQVEATAERVLRHGPRRVLEIGCGTGMLLFRIAPHCAEYWALDFSAEALDYVGRQSEMTGLPQVHLLQRTADDLSGVDGADFDVVIINSVVQYFPDAAYLTTVLQNATALVRDGGVVFVGDVRNYDLVEEFHASILVDQAPGATEQDDLRQAVERQARLEKELLLSPRHFAALRQAVPRIGAVEVQLRRGQLDSEITRYRYDVVLRVGAADDAVQPVSVDHRDGRACAPDGVLAQLRESAGAPLLVRNIPNRRVWADHLTWQELLREGQGSTVEDLRDRLRREQEAGQDPEQWWRAVDGSRYEVRIRWSEGMPARYDVLITDRADGSVWPLPMPVGAASGPATPRLANNPQQGQQLRSLVPSLRGFLADRLPSYMVPSVIVALDDLPTTSNGKIDRNRLPRPADDGTTESEGFVEPRTPLERTLARIWGHMLGVERVSAEADFFEMGGHSLMVAQLVAEIQKECAVQLPLRRFFENSSVARAARLIELVQRDGLDGLPDALTFPDLAAEARLDQAIHPQSAGVANVSPARVLLTGATGFLGAFLLQDLLTRTGAQVYALVRGAGDTSEAMQRIRGNLARWGIWDEAWSERITPIVGDLAKPWLGLTPGQFERLADEVEVIYHNGAEVNMVLPYHALRPVNVGGTTEILRLAATRTCKPVHYVSTLAALYLMQPTHTQTEVPLTVDELDRELLTSASNGYGVSKFVVEQILGIAAQRGIPVTVYRPGSITGHSRTGAANTADFLHAMLRESLTLGCLPQDIRLDPVPVDFVSRAVVDLSLNPTSAGKFFHLTNPRPIALEDFLAWARSRGFPVDLVDRKEWLRRVSERSQTAGDSLGAFTVLLQTLLDFRGMHRFMQAQIRQPDMTNTWRGLADGRVTCPAVDADLLDTYLDYFLATGFMSPPPADARPQKSATALAGRK